MIQLKKTYLFIILLSLGSCGSSVSPLVITNHTNNKVKLIIFYDEGRGKVYEGYGDVFLDSTTHNHYTIIDKSQKFPIGSSWINKEIDINDIDFYKLVFINGKDTSEVKGKPFIKQLFKWKSSERVFEIGIY